MHDGFDLHTFFWQCFNSINNNPTVSIEIFSSQNSFSKGGLAQLHNILERNHKDSKSKRQD